MRFVILLFFLLLLACTKKVENQDSSTAFPHTVQEKIELDTEFPIPELTQDNIKNVNAVLMEQLQQDLIDESQQQSLNGQQIKRLPVEIVDKPELEIEIEPPIFEIDQ